MISCSTSDFAKKYSFAEKTNTSKKYYYTLQNKSIIRAETDNKNIVTNNTAYLSFIYQLASDSFGNKVIKITYDKFNITSKKDDEEEEVYGSEKEGNSSPMMDRVLKKLKGQTIIITSDKNNKVLSKVGAKEISDKITSALPDYEDGSRKKIIQQLEDLIGDKFVNENIISNLSLIPDSALSIGSTWSQKMDVSGDLPIKATINYALENVENGIGNIKCFTEFVNEPGKTISIIGLNANADLKGTLEGNYQAIENSGLIISARHRIEG